MKGMKEIAPGTWVNQAWIDALKASKPNTSIWDAFEKLGRVSATARGTVLKTVGTSE